MDHTFSDQNYSKVCKFRTYTTCHSFLNDFLLIFKKGTVQWLECTYLKYELNRSYNGGGVVYVLKARHLIHPYSTLIGGEKVGSPWKRGYRLPWPWKTWLSFELNTWYPRFHSTGLPASKCGSLERDRFQRTKGKKLFRSKYICLCL